LHHHLQRVYMPILQIAARSYISGPRAQDAARIGRSLAARGIWSTMCYWDSGNDLPRAVADEYLAALAVLPEAGPDSYLSIKAPALDYRRDLLAEIVERAYTDRIRVHFDSLDVGTAERTFDLIAVLRASYPNLGCTLPGRWLRSVEDAVRAAELELAVRVVKGQWAATESQGLDPGTGFLQVVEALAGRARRVAIATHDAGLARQALCRLREAGTPCELELLYGLPVHGPMAVADALGIPVRVYVPYGTAWLPYALNHAKKNPRVFWWILKDAVRIGPRLPVRSSASSDQRWSEEKCR
jgi:proline dehydrogenase